MAKQKKKYKTALKEENGRTYRRLPSGGWALLCDAKKKNGERCKRTATKLGRCRVHGGCNPVGMASASYKHGRYSKHLPKGMAQLLAQAQADPELNNSRQDIALIQTFIIQRLEQFKTLESNKVWSDLKATQKRLEQARESGDNATMAQQLTRMGKLIKEGSRSYGLVDEVVNLVEKKADLVDKEEKRLIQAEQMISIEKASMTVLALIDVIREHVTDRLVLSKILQGARQLIDQPAVLEVEARGENQT